MTHWGQLYSGTAHQWADDWVAVWLTEREENRWRVNGWKFAFFVDPSQKLRGHTPVSIQLYLTTQTRSYKTNILDSWTVDRELKKQASLSFVYWTELYRDTSYCLQIGREINRHVTVSVNTQLVKVNELKENNLVCSVAEIALHPSEPVTGIETTLSDTFTIHEMVV